MDERIAELKPRPRARSGSQRARIEALLIERGPRGVGSFELFEMYLPRSAVVVNRLRKAGWVIDSLPEPGPRNRAGGVRYVARTAPGTEGEQREIVAEAREAIDDEREQLALELPPGPSTSAVFDDWNA